MLKKTLMFSAAQQDMTLLSMVRTDVTQITSLLETTFTEIESKDLTVAAEPYQVGFKPYFNQCKLFLFGQINHQAASDELKKSSSSGKGVCAKTLSYGDVAWKCETCEKDPTCIICQECFEAGDHKGHKVWLKRNVGGCCDCGDPDAWKEEGFCTKHKGYASSSEVLLEQLPQYIKRGAKYVFNHICLKLKVKSMELVVCHSKSGQYLGFTDPVTKKNTLKTSIIISMLFEFIDWVVDVSPAFIHFLTESMGENFLQEIRKIDLRANGCLGLQTPPGKDDRIHECCTRSFINEEERALYNKMLTDFIVEEDGRDSILLNNPNVESVSAEQDEIVEFSEERLEQVRAAKNICTCTVLDLTFQVNHMIIESTRHLQYELYFKMFQSFKFKQYLGLSFAANFQRIQILPAKTKHKISSIGVQLLTIDDIALMIMKDSHLRQNLLDTYEQIVDDLIESEFSEANQSIMYSILYEFKYMARTKCLTYSIAKTNFVEGLIEQMTKFYYLDTIELKTEHVMFDQALIKEGLLNMEIFLVKIVKTFLKAVDPSDVPRNKRLMQAFLSLFEEINDRMPTEGSRGFFALPLHHVFSYYFSRLIMQNYLVEYQAFVATGKPVKELFMDIMKRYIEIPPGQNQWRYIQSLIETILKPLARSWAFIHEVMSGKWVMSGLFITQLARVHYSVYEYYLLMNVGLFQMMLVVSPDPQKTLELIVGGFTTDVWMRKLHDKLINTNPSAEAPYITLEKKDFSQYANIFDEKKLRQLLHWELRLLVQLCVTEAGFIFPLLTNLSAKENLTFPLKSASTPAIEGLFKADMQRSIVHALVLLGGRADFKQIKKQLETTDIYTESEKFEDALLAVASQVKDASGKKIQFKLKEDVYLNWFEPYFYLIPESQVKVHEVLQGVYQEKKLINEVLGDYQDSYKYQTHVNTLIKDALTHSPLLFKVLTSVLYLWCTQQQSTTLKVIDDQIAFESLKLLHTIAKQMTRTSSSVSAKDQFIRCVKERDFQVVKLLREKVSQQSGTALDKAVKEVFHAVYDVDKGEFGYIGEVLGVKTQDNIMDDSEESKLEELTILQPNLKKQQSKLKQELILQKFKSQRQDFMTKSQVPSSQTPSSLRLTPSTSRMDTSSIMQEEEIECSLCKETLTQELFYSHPYGQFGYVSTSKLLYHAYRQTLETSSDDRPLVESPAQTSHKEEQKVGAGVMEQISDQKEQLNPIEVLGDVSYLEYINGTGGTLIKCSHYAHYKCLSSYLTANEADQNKRNIRKIIGLDFNNFQCPLCKHIANVLLPCDTMTGYTENKVYQQDFNQYDLLEFHTRLLSKIVQKQLHQTKEILPVDIRRDPLSLLTGVQQFIEHRLHLLDVKGVEEFLKSHSHKAGLHNRVGKDQYADIIETTRNVINVILDGTIPVAVVKKEGEDTDMTEHTLEQICLGEISKVLQSRKGWRILESDFSSVAIQLMFYTSMVISPIDKFDLIDKALNAIARSVFSLFKYQTLLKALYTKQQITSSTTTQELKGLPHELFNALSDKNSLLSLQNDLKFHEQFIVPTQLPFLRKLAAFKVLIRTLGVRAQTHTSLEEAIAREERIKLVRERDEKFVNNLASQVDDMEEHTLLSEYLEFNVEGKMDFIGLPDELIEVLRYISSEEEQKNMLESYGISSLMQVLNPELSQSAAKPILLSHLQQSDHTISLPLPPRMRLLNGLKFKLVELPSDFQTLVQKYYKERCRNCHSQPKESCVCLLCGDIVCYMQKCCSGSGVLKGAKVGEGELSYHARTCEGGNCIFLCTTNGKIIMVDEERSSQRVSPYLNKFGEAFSSSSKRWDNYHLQNGQNGTPNLYDELKKLYLNFGLPNEVIKDRSMSDVVWRLRAV